MTKGVDIPVVGWIKSLPQEQIRIIGYFREFFLLFLAQ
jgi:hypothetical protein